MAGTLRILLVDDHNLVRSGLRALIDSQTDMAVIGEAADGEQACRLAAELDPDVIVMDVSMPKIGGAKATELILREHPGTRILALTVHEDRSYLQQMLQAGAAGYLLKRAAADELIHAVRVIARGGTYLDSQMVGGVLGGLLRKPTPGTPPEDVVLSDREEEVVRMIARGFTNREIAGQLDLSVKTVETHKARALEKLNLRSRADLVGYAIGRGWLSSG